MKRNGGWTAWGVVCAMALGNVGAVSIARGSDASKPEADAYGWLEEIEGERALAWVKQRNAITEERLEARADYGSLLREAREVLGSASRLPTVEAHGGYLYNLWQDASHPRGLFRRTSVAEFRREHPAWETVLDIDALARAEGRPWALGEDSMWLQPRGERVLLALSPGGGDAVEYREFDLNARRFVENGFAIPVGKSRVAWADENTLYVGADFGAGSLTESGYPRIVKRWRRGTPLSAAETIYEAPTKAVWAVAQRFGEGTEAVHVVTEAVTYWTASYFEVQDGGVIPLQIPTSARLIDGLHGRLILLTREAWQVGEHTIPAGSVVAADPAALRGGAGEIVPVVVPTERVVVEDVKVGKHALYVAMLDNVRGRLDRVTQTKEGWSSQTLALPENAAIEVQSVDPESDAAWIEVESFTMPPTLFHVAGEKDGAVEKVKAQAPTFDGEKYETRQLWCTSADGTRVPYFVVAAKGMAFDGTHAVWMFSYGGFENALKPSYSGSYEELHGAYGKLWLERGGVFVLANIRGGGEFGPAWHLSALKENHVKCLEDFEAVARDLVARKITTPARLGIEGRSNGGLLVASTMLRHPELYGAVVCGNPLLDMRRYHRLLAGASWMAEYGDPDKPEEWAFLSGYSPYQNVRAGMTLPPILFYTTTRDDRVHPGHARKMAAKMDALGYAVDYYENTEGGHHGSVTSEQLATRIARTYAFLWEKLNGAPAAGQR